MFETLQARWALIAEKIDARIVRERVLIFLTLLALLFMLWDVVYQNSVDKKLKDVNGRLALLATDRTTLQTQIAAATQNLLNDPDKPKKAQIEQLKSEVASAQQTLQTLSQGLIKAEQLPRALQDVLQKTDQLTLLEVKTLPARELQLTQVNAPSPADSNTTEDLNAGVYEHVVELRVSGSFNQINAFLKALEESSWRFYWQSLEYKVTHYPAAEMKLRVYTLSSEEGLLGV